MQTNSGETDKQLSTATRFSIATWNVNGIRAVFRKERLAEFIGRYDYVCFQETKLSTDDLDYELVELAGYQSYWASCTTRKGYSGVAIYTKHTYVLVLYRLSLQKSQRFCDVVYATEAHLCIMDVGLYLWKLALGYRNSIKKVEL
jgi:exodeoxyribonuclease-3